MRLLALDVASVLICWVLLGFALSSSTVPMQRLAPGLAGAAATLLASGATCLYRSRICARGVEELTRVALACAAGAGAFLIAEWRLGAVSPHAFLSFAACVVMMVSCRRQFGRWLRARRAQGSYLRAVVLVGSNHDAIQLREMLSSEPELGYVVSGVVGDDGEGGELADLGDLPSAPSIADIPQLARATEAGGVLVVPQALSSAQTQRAIAVATDAGLHVQVWPGLRGVGSRRLRAVPMSGEAFFYVEPPSSARWQAAVKRVMDVMIAGLVCIATLPLVALAALLIKLDSPGPVLYRGQRIGLHGKPFVAFKLRSMHTNDDLGRAELARMNERTGGPLFKAANDPRVTRVGRLLRASSIDELPQLWNVLQGTMSLVGPRPALPDEVEQFDDELLRRHSVRPGVTGLWQIEARRNPSFLAYRRLDLSYVDNWSLALDLSILAATVPSVVTHALRDLRRRRTR